LAAISSETQAIASETQVELHTDKNQALARLDQRLSSSDDGRSTSDRVEVLNPPKHTQGLFKLRLAANPSSSEQFGPWHLADQIASSSPTEAARRMPNDAFAIRYRVM
jgi:hypothetical protein